MASYLRETLRECTTFLLGLMVGGSRNECNDILGDGLEFGGGQGEAAEGAVPWPQLEWRQTWFEYPVPHLLSDMGPIP